MQSPKYKTDQTAGNSHTGQGLIDHHVALLVTGEYGPQAAHPQPHGKAETIRQTATVSGRIFGDQAVVDRLVREMDECERRRCQNARKARC